MFRWEAREDRAVKRRDFITLLGGVAAWPLAAHAQQHERMRRIGVLMGLSEGDPGTRDYVQELKEGLRGSGWSDGENLQVAYRYAGGNPERARTLAKDLVALKPELVV